eukprot:TRINITY_DN2995_c1_g1_i1.p2 TRINITY_DN2995_c1_g1~~TRINITY_DN2995_c1_g1_i1.p2  ORF type:complete len:159 (+),score=19.10 TRINITY_DN2995_c1_g1_i1:54-530(+)
MADYGTEHGPSCGCRVNEPAAVRVRCKACGISLQEDLTGKPCFACGDTETVSIKPNRGDNEWKAEIVAKHGIGTQAWNRQREQWTTKTANARPGTKPTGNPRTYEAQVLNWVEKGGTSSSSRPSATIPLNVLIKALQQLETWVPIGRLDHEYKRPAAM